MNTDFNLEQLGVAGVIVAILLAILVFVWRAWMDERDYNRKLVKEQQRLMENVLVTLNKWEQTAAVLLARL